MEDSRLSNKKKTSGKNEKIRDKNQNAGLSDEEDKVDEESRFLGQ
jgi:hypothetical protein